jgi:hypothetical protein
MRNRLYFTYCFPIYKCIVRCYDTIAPYIEIFNQNDKYSLTLKIPKPKTNLNEMDSQETSFGHPLVKSLIKSASIPEQLENIFCNLIVSTSINLKYDKTAITMQKTGQVQFTIEKVVPGTILNTVDYIYYLRLTSYPIWADIVLTFNSERTVSRSCFLPINNWFLKTNLELYEKRKDKSNSTEKLINKIEVLNYDLLSSITNFRKPLKFDLEEEGHGAIY